ncbi:MAG: hypothetical protein ACE5NM_04165 [Sedimentisphaerales bacterium]
MKESPQMQKLNDLLRSSKLVAGGFMGSDTRSVSEIIDADAAQLARFGFTARQVAARMQQITDVAKTALGNWVKIDDKRQAQVQEAKGAIVCPWPHPGRFTKRVTTVNLIESDKSIYWSDLNIHLITQHGFFEGKGSNFRIEPEILTKIIF